MNRLLLFAATLASLTSLALADISGPPEGTGSVAVSGHTFTMSVKATGLPYGCVLVEITRDFSDANLQPDDNYSFQWSIQEFVPEGGFQSSTNPTVTQYQPMWPTTENGHYIEHERHIWSTHSCRNGFWRITATATAHWNDSSVSDALIVSTGYMMVSNLHTSTNTTAPAIIRVGEDFTNPTNPAPIAVSFADEAYSTGTYSDPTNVSVSIYPIDNITTPVRALEASVSSPSEVFWDGKDGSGQEVSDGLYTYAIHLEHDEYGWDGSAFPYQRTTSVTCGFDEDNDTSTVGFSSLAVQQQGTPNEGCVPFSVTYTLSAPVGTDCQACSLCGVRVYHSLYPVPVYVNDALATALGTNTVTLQVPDCGPGSYYFVMWGRDGNFCGKAPYTWYGCGRYSHLRPLTKRIRERGAVYQSSSSRTPSVEINQAEGQMDPTTSNVIHFTAVFGAVVTDFSEDDVDLSERPAGTQVAVTKTDELGQEYDVAVTLPPGTGATIAVTIPAGAAGTGSSAASTSLDNTVSYDPQNAIRVDGQGGNDLNDGSSWSRAKATIEAALSDAASTSKEIWVASGVYVTSVWGFMVPEDVKMYGGFAGTEALRDDRDWHAHETILVGPGGGGTIVTAADGCIVDGFTFAYQDEGVYTGGSATIANNRFDPTVVYGIRCEGSSPKVMGNLFSGNWTGILLESSSSVICNNVIKLCGEAGILSRGADTSAITNNTIVDCEVGILADGYGTTGTRLIANNIVASSVAYGIKAMYGASAAVGYNCVCDTISGISYSGVSAGTGWVSSTPTFVGNGDYHLASASSAGCDAGDSGLVASDFDFDGSVRCQDAVDMGAYEYNKAVPPDAPVVTDDGTETCDLTSLHAVWNVFPESFSVQYEYVVNTSVMPPAPESAEWISAGSATGVTVQRQANPLVPNATYYFHVRAKIGRSPWTSPGRSDGITAVQGVAQIAPITFSPPPGNRYETVALTISCPTPGVTIEYSVDGSATAIYDGTHPILLAPHSSAAIVHVTASKVGYISRVQDAVYTWTSAHHASPPPYNWPTINYNCIVRCQVQAAPVYALRAYDIYIDGSLNEEKALCLKWFRNNDRFRLRRTHNGSAQMTTDDLTDSSYVDAFNFEFDEPGQSHIYQYEVWLPAGADTSKDNNYWPEKEVEDLTDGDVPYYRYQWDDGSPTTITVVPKQVLASDNQSVDSRLDIREGDDVPLDYQFRSSTFRGGLFVGARSPQAGYLTKSDGSGVARSFLKFGLTHPAAGNRLWSGGLYAHYLSSREEGVTTVVGCQPVHGTWSDDTIKWRDSINEVNPRAYYEAQSVEDAVGSNSSARWCGWRSMFGPMVEGMYGSSAEFSAVLAATNEPSEPLKITGTEADATGWAYFAKKQYDEYLGPRLVYAEGNAPCFVANIELDAHEVRSGGSIDGIVYLNSPAPEGGLTIKLLARTDIVRVSDALIPAGETKGGFTVRAAYIDPSGLEPTVTIAEEDLAGGIHGASVDLTITH